MPRVIRPHAQVFKLGKHIKIGGKRIPKPLVDVACCAYRTKDSARELGHVAEDDVSKEHAVLVARGINEFIGEWSLLKELISDRELQGTVTEAPVFRYYAGGDIDELRAALETAGFVVAETIDPHAEPYEEPTPEAIVARSLASIERYLDLSSLDLVLERIQSGGKLLPHASSAQYALSYGLEHHRDALLEHLERAPWSWHPELRDLLLVLFGKLVHDGTANGAGVVMERLPAAMDPNVAELLDSWGLPRGRAAPPSEKNGELATPTKKGKAGATAKKGKATAAAKKKRRPPRSGDTAALIRYIEETARLAGVQLAPGATDAAIAATERALGVELPDEVRAFYLAHDGASGEARVADDHELFSLEEMVISWKALRKLDCDDERDVRDARIAPDHGVQAKCWAPGWIPFTQDDGGNHYMIDLAPAPGGQRGQVLSVWHDDPTRGIRADDFLDWLVDQPWST